MKNKVCLTIAAVAALCLCHPGTAFAQAKTIAVDCAPEIRTFCANVSPGNDRVVACLIAYEDKISPRCRLTAYLGSGKLGKRMKEVQEMAKICSSDIYQYCSKVPAGGGRIADCLKKHKVTLTDDCRKEAHRFEAIFGQ